MGQGVTHMTIINASPVQATVSAHVHGLMQNSHEQHTEVIYPQQSQLVSLTRQAAGDYRVDWSINFNNGTHAEWNNNLPPGHANRTMLLGNDRITIDGHQVARIKKGTSARHPHHDQGARFPAPIDVPPNALPAGRVIHLRSFKTGKNVQILQDGTIRALGGNGPLTRFIVDPTPTGYLRLRSEKFPQHYLALKGVAGQGGSACHLRAQMVCPSRYILRSLDSSKGIGFRADGSIKPSQEVGTGDGASFAIVFADVSVPPAAQNPYAPPPAGHNPYAPPPAGHNPYAPPPAGHNPYAPPPSGHNPYAPPPAGHNPYAPPPAGHNPYAPPPAGHNPYAPPPAGQYPPPPAGQYPPPPAAHHPPPPAAHRPPSASTRQHNVHPLLKPNTIIRLKSKKTGKYVRITKDSRMNANGGLGPLTKFRVSPSGKGFIRLESVQFPGQFLSHKGSVGQGGPMTEFVAHPVGGKNELNFRSIDGSKGLGFVQTGDVKPPTNVGRGAAATFVIERAA